MKNMTLSAIAEACHGTLTDTIKDSSILAESVVIDSREVHENSIFIATKGERVDGHQFIQQVFDQGALGVVCEYIPDGVTRPCIVVKDSILALQMIAKYYRSQLSLPVVGITGSAGKTSTKECISGVLSQKYDVLKTKGNLNNEIGLPLTILRIRDNHNVAVVEMGISAFGEMEVLSNIAKPDICVLTNIGDGHLEQLINREGVLKEKSQIFSHMNPNGSVCLFGDDPLLKTIQSVNNKPVITYGLQETNTIYASDIKTNQLMGSSFMLHTQDNTFDASIPLPGIHMVINALAASAVAQALGMNIEEIKQGLASIQTIAGRSNVIQHNTWTIIDDCYNANPSSMKAAIDMLTSVNTRTVAILGDMKELGENEIFFHEEIGEYAGKAKVDVLLCTGELAKAFLNKIEHTTAIHYDTRDNLIADLPNILRTNDTILIKASHSMGFEHIVRAIQDANEPKI